VTPDRAYIGPSTGGKTTILAFAHVVKGKTVKHRYLGVPGHDQGRAGNWKDNPSGADQRPGRSPRVPAFLDDGTPCAARLLGGLVDTFGRP